MNSEDYILVIGASNIDIGGTSYKELIPADSNPGSISISYGGVARNIAHNLCLLGVKVKFITAIGSDVLGREMIKHCESLGMDISDVIYVPDSSSSMYLYINDRSGDMAMSIDQMDIVKNITPDHIDSIKDVINSARAVVIDGNLSFESVLRLKEICERPLYIDPVSTVLAERISPALDGMEMIKPNRLEAEYMTGMTIRTEADYKAAARAILDMGVKRVFLSIGSDGILAADNNNMYVVGGCRTDVVCTAGAGDSAIAAIVWASEVVADRMSLVTAAKAANAVGSMTVSVQETIYPELTHDNALNKMINTNMKVRKI